MNQKTRAQIIMVGLIILMCVAFLLTIKHSIDTLMHFFQSNYSMGYLAVETTLPIALAMGIFFGIKVLSSFK